MSRGYARAFLSEPIDPDELMPLVAALECVQEQGERWKKDQKPHYSKKVDLLLLLLLLLPLLLPQNKYR